MKLLMATSILLSLLFISAEMNMFITRRYETFLHQRTICLSVISTVDNHNYSTRTSKVVLKVVLAGQKKFLPNFH